MTNKDLLNFNFELNQMQSSVLSFLLQGRIQEYSKQFNERTQTLFDKITKKQKEYFVFDADEKGVDRMRFTKKGDGTDVAVLQEGKSYEEYTKWYNELLDEPVSNLKL